MKLNDEICRFCKELWGEDRHKTCSSPCPCAEYVRQDHVYQRETTIGLPAPMSLVVLQKGDDIPYWHKLPQEAQRRVALRYADLAKKLPFYLSELLKNLIEGYTKSEICQLHDWAPSVYDTYLDRLKEEVKELDGTQSDM